jgi:hypothetical protein
MAFGSSGTPRAFSQRQESTSSGHCGSRRVDGAVGGRYRPSGALQRPPQLARRGRAGRSEPAGRHAPGALAKEARIRNSSSLFVRSARVQHCQSPSKGAASGLLGSRPSRPNRPFSGEATMSADITKPSLYDRLGGIYAIASVVDDFIDRIMIDPALNARAASVQVVSSAGSSAGS